mmetsp:Transcript_23922/g.74821  ORF Transcript_23922/g.74821 Transcript_23922/m.74821 type:complete len:365 (-) Transcript_23922:43-1137(-)
MPADSPVGFTTVAKDDPCSPRRVRESFSSRAVLRCRPPSAPIGLPLSCRLRSVVLLVRPCASAKHASPEMRQCERSSSTRASLDASMLPSASPASFSRPFHASRSTFRLLMPLLRSRLLARDFPPLGPIEFQLRSTSSIVTLFRSASDSCAAPGLPTRLRERLSTRRIWFTRPLPRSAWEMAATPASRISHPDSSSTVMRRTPIMPLNELEYLRLPKPGALAAPGSGLFPRPASGDPTSPIESLRCLFSCCCMEISRMRSFCSSRRIDIARAPSQRMGLPRRETSEIPRFSCRALASMCAPSEVMRLSRSSSLSMAALARTASARASHCAGWPTGACAMTAVAFPSSRYTAARGATPLSLHLAS